MKSFPFEFFRSRFRRKSLKKFGGVNEDPLHILPSNGGRTYGVLFEFQGEVAESTSIENILERKLRQAEFLGQADEILRISDTLKVLQSRPSQLTKEQCKDGRRYCHPGKQKIVLNFMFLVGYNFHS